MGSVVTCRHAEVLLKGDCALYSFLRALPGPPRAWTMQRIWGLVGSWSCPLHFEVQDLTRLHWFYYSRFVARDAADLGGAFQLSLRPCCALAMPQSMSSPGPRAPGEKKKTMPDDCSNGRSTVSWPHSVHFLNRPSRCGSYCSALTWCCGRLAGTVLCTTGLGLGRAARRVALGRLHHRNLYGPVPWRDRVSCDVRGAAILGWFHLHPSGSPRRDKSLSPR